MSQVADLPDTDKMKVLYGYLKPAEPTKPFTDHLLPVLFPFLSFTTLWPSAINTEKQPALCKLSIKNAPLAPFVDPAYTYFWPPLLTFSN